VMPRTKGAIDKRPRKHSTAVKKKRAQPAASVAPRDSAPPAPAADCNSRPAPEFFNAIDAALHEPQVESGAQAATVGTTPACPPAPVSDDPPLTCEAWEGVLRVPFRLLSAAAGAPGVAQIGVKRAKDLARPSYIIFEHYAREYLAMNPDDPLSLAWAATGLVLADIAADVAVEIGKARADRRGELPAGAAEGKPLNQAA
jgi:hypothetical protein